ncbi:hypothetical protein [Haloarchaeobius sp. DFWS5]|uniref:hypothetical protein n=1 Tax=Haloarchaeobius sp. DFWS5 TaxID=3446114 RepID=UPI003EBECA14
MTSESVSQTDLGGLVAVTAAVVAVLGTNTFQFPTLEPAWLSPVVSVGLTATLVFAVSYATLRFVKR